MMKHALWLILAVIAVGTASAQDLPRGRIIDDVQCGDDASQHYALYLPSNFTPARRWPVIFAFDARARGRVGVEQYQAAAEEYGYIVAGSNNSRNGPLQVSTRAANAMAIDIDKRFPVDPKRIYTAGMSGGARVAMLLALNPELITGGNGSEIAGVLASSAGFPGTPHDSVPFPIFGTAGTDDFNHHEMYELDHGLSSPHRVEVFDGGHVWPPVELATDGVEWMEIQAMKSGGRSRDSKLVDKIFAARMVRAEAQKSRLEKMRELGSIAVDFRGLKDVSTLVERAAALEREPSVQHEPSVQDELKAERAAEQREVRTTTELYQLQGRMGSAESFAKLKERVTTLAEQSRAAEDSTDRRIARRVLAGLSIPPADIRHPEFQELRDLIRPPGQSGRPQ